jgi:hypothetical protein
LFLASFPLFRAAPRSCRAPAFCPEPAPPDGSHPPATSVADNTDAGRNVKVTETCSQKTSAVAYRRNPSARKCDAPVPTQMAAAGPVPESQFARNLPTLPPVPFQRGEARVDGSAVAAGLRGAIGVTFSGILSPPLSNGLWSRAPEPASTFGVGEPKQRTRSGASFSRMPCGTRWNDLYWVRHTGPTVDSVLGLRIWN